MIRSDCHREQAKRRRSGLRGLMDKELVVNEKQIKSTIGVVVVVVVVKRDVNLF